MNAANVQAFSPSASKPAKVIADWRAKGYGLDVKKPIQVSRKTMAQAHNPHYVQSVLSCTAPNGFGNTDEGVAAGPTTLFANLIPVGSSTIRLDSTSFKLKSGSLDCQSYFARSSIAAM